MVTRIVALVAMTLPPIVSLGDGPPFVEIREPRGAEWARVQSNAYSAVWMKRTGKPDISFGLAVLSQQILTVFDSPGAFADWVRTQKAANPAPDRFDTVRNDVSPAGVDRPTCVRYETVVLDRTPGGRPQRLEIGGLACLHPEAPDRYYDVQYSGRTPDTMRLDATLLREGRSFVDSVRFTTPDEKHAPAGGPEPVEREST
jgi:hypothetical protein